jgi:hypothetical protein
MAQPNGLNPNFYALTWDSVTLTPAAAASSVNTIPPGVRSVRLGANVNDANDFTVLPPLASVPNGFTILLVAGSAANSELRTPASSAEEINSEDCDGTKEALLTAGNVYEVIKIDNTIGWMLRSFTPVGTVVASITPD